MIVTNKVKFLNVWCVRHIMSYPCYFNMYIDKRYVLLAHKYKFDHVSIVLI